MAYIQVLDPHVADLIAAGEVVERPASVVKELVENAIDAGATSVTVEIQKGGMSLIRVADNGSGIPWEDCETAFLRHATSKLRTSEDLAAIGTLGFRGEALAAISSVSRVELFTRTAREDLGTSLSIEGGLVMAKDQAGCPLGTTLVVRDLFYNTPARLKFMKRDAAEGAAVFALVQKLALSHPEVALKFIRDGKQELLSPGDGKLKSAMYAVFGRDIALGFTPVQSEAEEVTVSGFVSLPACCRGTRSYQHFFVNGRQVKSRLLMTALEKAYENQKMVGKFPGCVLQLEVKPSTVDVNVHPAKTEVKFLYERKVFDGVYYAVLSALNGEDRHPTMDLPAPRKVPTPPPPMASTPAPKAPVSTGGFTRMTAQEFRKSPSLRDSGGPKAPSILRPVEKAYTPAYTPPPGKKEEFSPEFAEKSTVFPRNVEKPVENVEKSFVPVVEKPRAPLDTPPAPPAPEPEQIRMPAPPVEPVKAEPVPEPIPEEAPWRLAGEVLNTYLIVERGEEILLIDKHAAHERLNFDRMKESGYQPMAQTLLAPVVFTPSPEEGAVLLENLDLLERYGFACSDFGGGSLAIREVPDYLEPGQAEEALCEIASQLLLGDPTDPDSARDAVLHTMACKAAVKGGQKNSREELLVVARAVVTGQVKYCPHGRPVAITLTRAQLERQFKRA
ncbi:MAG: DNA mismatch repair endonuclease MutL [Ruminiclostridium sp.]|nr:DNA mismatch repair endonuclease MutL [Ruminiclostridium sp.]